MLTPLSPDIRGDGMTYQGGSSQRDASIFESYLEKLSSNSFRRVDPGDFQAKDLVENILSSPSNADRDDSSTSSQLGERILTSLSNSNTQYNKFLQHVEDMRTNNEVANPLQLIMAQALLVNATTSIEFATRAIIKVSTVLDTMLRLQ